MTILGILLVVVVLSFFFGWTDKDGGPTSDGDGCEW